VGHQAAEPYGVDVHAVDDGPSRPVEGRRRGVGDGAETCVRASRRDPACRVDRRPGGGVHLVRMVQFDHLGGLEPRGRLRGERHGEHRREREVGGDEHARRAACRSLQVLLHPPQRLVRPAGGPDDGVHPGVDEGVHVGLGGLGEREVDRHVGVPREGGNVVVDVQCGDQLEVRRCLHGRHDRAPHASCRAEHGHPRRHGPQG